MNEEGYYILFFICVGLLIFLFYYNQQQGLSGQQTMQPRYLQPQPRQPQQSIHQYHTHEHQQMNKKTNNMDYTYNIENIDIRKDNLSEKDKNNRLGTANAANAANAKYEPELEDVYKTTLRGSGNHSNEPDEMFNYCIKPNKSDLPIVNPPLQLLLNNAPLRLSERHSHSM